MQSSVEDRQQLIGWEFWNSHRSQRFLPNTHIHTYTHKYICTNICTSIHTYILTYNAIIQFSHTYIFLTMTLIGSIRICEPCVFRCHQGHKGVRLIKESPVQCNCGEVCAVVAETVAVHKEDAYCKACVISKTEKKVLKFF